MDEYRFILNENGKFRDISNESNLENTYGLWFNVIETDINNDGLNDYLVGNIGENSKYKTSIDKPLKYLEMILMAMELMTWF